MADPENITRFSDDSVNPNLIAAYPQGLDNSWEGAPYHRKNLPSDNVFVSYLLTYIRAQYCVDDERIYTTGMSNGGGFVNTLACFPNHGADFAAFAPVSGAFYDDNIDLRPSKCQPAHLPLPIVEFRGIGDTKIPYFGPESEHSPVPSIPK
ncbi:MAG: hypothetical protein Q9166_001500 [cf. Caloplaca sp. 2 TL-2023]